MSPNPNYTAGRRFEYERLKYWKEVMDHTCLRTAGSHGFADLITISPFGDVQFIQCKRVSTQAEATQLLKEFKKNPPLWHRPNACYDQVMEVRVKGNKEIQSVRV